MITIRYNYNINDNSLESSDELFVQLKPFFTERYIFRGKSRGISLLIPYIQKQFCYNTAVVLENGQVDQISNDHST